MPRPGFYNDNEYRAYPFQFQPAYDGPALPDSAVVDAGIIMGLDSGFEAGTHTVWLASVERAAGVITFTFATDAPGASGAALTFEVPEAAEDWFTVHGASDAAASACATEPRWEGFLVPGPLAPLVEFLSANGNAVAFSTEDRVLEPGRTQSLVKSYLRSVNVGNFPRVRATPPDVCDESSEAADTGIVVNATCMRGNIRIKEGYNCIIRQTDRTRTLTVGAGRGAGDTNTGELCEHGSQVPLYPNEPADPDTGLFSGGQVCSQLIFALNGLNTPNISFVPGTGVRVTTDVNTNTVTIALAQNNLVGDCNT